MRAISTPTPSASTAWPSLDQSILANIGDVRDMEIEDEEAEVRTVRLVEPARAQDQVEQDEDDLSGEVLAMDVDREQARARARDRTMGRDRNARGRGRTGRYMDN